MNADGTNRVPIAPLRQPSTGPDPGPRWRENCLFELWQYWLALDIFVVDPDGTNLSTIWDDSDDDWWTGLVSRWKPDCL